MRLASAHVSMTVCVGANAAHDKHALIGVIQILISCTIWQRVCGPLCSHNNNYHDNKNYNTFYL